MDTINEYLSLNGITESELVLDGTIKSITTDKFKGWYIGDSLGPGKRSITIENWKTRDRKHFTEGIDMSDPLEVEKLQESREKFEREKLEIQISNKKMAQKHFKKFEREKWDGFSKYLSGKKIDSSFGALQIQSPGIGTDVVLPLRDSKGELWNYQTITESGMKTFVPGALVDGLWFELQGKTLVDPEIVIITEGFATACSVKMAVPYARVLCAFSSGNLSEAAENIRKLNPHAKIIMASDDDWKVEGNPGETKGREAAEKVSGFAVLPIFPKVRGADWKDYNDLHSNYGISEVTKQLTAAVERAAPPTKEWLETFQTVNALVEKDTKSSLKAADAHIQHATSHKTITPYINGVVPLPMKIGKSGAPIIPPEFQAADALFKYYEGRAVKSEGSLFIYENNYWHEVNEAAESKMKLQIQVLYDGLAANGKLENTWRQFLNIVPEAPRNLFESNQRAVNLKNGTLHVIKLNDKWSLEFREHNRLDYCTNIIPIEYDRSRSIRNKGFEEMVTRIFDGAPDRDEKIQAIRQMYGACVAPVFPHLFMIWGPGGSGKTSLIIPAQRLIHQDNWSSVEPHEFEGFKMESMAGKLVNIVTDINLDEPIKDNHVKKIEDQKPVRIDRKFKNALMAMLPFVHIFGGNDIPATFEKGSGAHERRWTFLQVEGFKAQGNYSKTFANDVFDESPEGVLNFALDGLEELLEANGHYFVPESSKERMKNWQIANDPVALFVEHIKSGEVKEFKFDPETRVNRAHIWPVFVDWYKDSYNKNPRINRQKFLEVLVKVRSMPVTLGYREINGYFYAFGLRDTFNLSSWRKEMKNGTAQGSEM